MAGMIFGVSLVAAAIGCTSEWFFGPYSMGGVAPYLGAFGLIGVMAAGTWVFAGAR